MSLLQCVTKKFTGSGTSCQGWQTVKNSNGNVRHTKHEKANLKNCVKVVGFVDNGKHAVCFWTLHINWLPLRCPPCTRGTLSDMSAQWLVRTNDWQMPVKWCCYTNQQPAWLTFSIPNGFWMQSDLNKKTLLGELPSGQILLERDPRPIWSKNGGCSGKGTFWWPKNYQSKQTTSCTSLCCCTFLKVYLHFPTAFPFTCEPFHFLWHLSSPFSPKQCKRLAMGLWLCNKSQCIHVKSVSTIMHAIIIFFFTR